MSIHKHALHIQSIPALSFILLLGLSFFTGACRKHQDAKPASDSTQQNTGGTATQSLSDEDSLKYYIHRLMLVTITEGADTVVKIPQYLWYKQVTASINPFSPAFPKAEDLLNYIISFPQNPSDRYSFWIVPGRLPARFKMGRVDWVLYPVKLFHRAL